MYQNNLGDTHLKPMKCRAICTPMLKCVMNRNCFVLQLKFVLTVKNTVWNHTFGLTPFSLFVIQVTSQLCMWGQLHLPLMKLQQQRIWLCFINFTWFWELLCLIPSSNRIDIYSRYLWIQNTLYFLPQVRKVSKSLSFPSVHMCTQYSVPLSTRVNIHTGTKSHSGTPDLRNRTNKYLNPVIMERCVLNVGSVKTRKIWNLNPLIHLILLKKCLLQHIFVVLSLVQ